tara:strand:- start:5562 stop:6314 length:753 start_codon:yes stop_codon:yes gene_type:complete
MRAPLAYQPFVLISTARTGSSLLWSYLNSHPDILCLRGIYGSRSKINFGKHYKELPEEFSSNQLIKLRNEQPIEFLAKYVWKQYPTALKAVGFKYFYNHNRHLLDKNSIINYLKYSENIKFIHLKRENLLDVLFSYTRALSQNKWTHTDEEFETTFTIQECTSFFNEIRQSQQLYDLLFNKRMIQIKYEDLLTRPGQTLSLVQEFIGAEIADLTAETRRNTKVNLSRSITNYKELKAYFNQTEYSAFFIE